MLIWDMLFVNYLKSIKIFYKIQNDLFDLGADIITPKKKKFIKN